MSELRFLREHEVCLTPANFPDQTVLSIPVSDEKAQVEKVMTWTKDGARYLVFTIRDRGDWGNPRFHLSVDVVLRTGSCTVMPKTATRLLGRVSNLEGTHNWFVFARKEGAPVEARERHVLAPSMPTTSVRVPSPVTAEGGTLAVSAQEAARRSTQPQPSHTPTVPASPAPQGASPRRAP